MKQYANNKRRAELGTIPGAGMTDPGDTIFFGYV